MICPKQLVAIDLSADGTCVSATDRKEGYVLRKLQRGLTVLSSGVSAVT
jgi:hypothetical protein